MKSRASTRRSYSDKMNDEKKIGCHENFIQNPLTKRDILI